MRSPGCCSGMPAMSDHAVRAPGPATVPTRRRALRTLAALGIATLALPGRAQSWPSRPIRMIVPFPAGSSPDLIARILSEKLSTVLGQAVVVENRPGAGGNIGTGMVAKAAPDGYTLLLTINGPLVTAPTLYRHLGYDPVRQLAPITLEIGRAHV